jgi:hypothetical protein
MALLQGINKIFGLLLDDLDCVSAVKEAMELQVKACMWWRCFKGGKGHMIAKSGSVTYLMRSNPVKVFPQIGGNCTEEIPVTWRNGSFFVDPISYVIKMAASPAGMSLTKLSLAGNHDVI